MLRFCMAFLLGICAVTAPVFAQQAALVHGIAMNGAPKYAPDFKHFDYVNPDAPKGGTLRMAALGTFDSLNPFIIKGVPAGQVGIVYETLLASAADEPFSEYGLIAESVEVPADRSRVTFNLRPEAKFHDGVAITSADVVWSFETLRDKGAPFYRAYYADVKDVKAEGPRRVTFVFSQPNRELPLTLGQMPVLPKHAWVGRDFAETTLTPPLGSGPYKVTKVDTGRSITLERVRDWWGAHLPVNRGRYNFDVMVTDYYRDNTVAVEAFFAHKYDVRAEHVAKIWATGYDAPAVKDGRIIKAEIQNSLPVGMQAFVMNTRRPIFKDRAVRQALQYGFDFEWSNKTLAHGAYKRTGSYFENSDYAAKGLPTGRELEILNSLDKADIPPEVFTTSYKNPVTDGSGLARANLRTGIAILEAAGYKVGPDGIRVHASTGQRLAFEIVDNQPEFERWVLPYIGNLKRMGIEVRFRTVDTAQYSQMLQTFDFDMTVHSFPQSLSPGNEQRDYWGSAKADAEGSRNLIGVKNKAVDTLVDAIGRADTPDELKANVRALDRILLWNFYVVPQWYVNTWRVAYWNQFEKPAKQAPYDLGITDTWWAKPVPVVAPKK